MFLLSSDDEDFLSRQKITETASDMILLQLQKVSILSSTTMV